MPRTVFAGNARQITLQRHTQQPQNGVGTTFSDPQAMRRSGALATTPWPATTLPKPSSLSDVEGSVACRNGDGALMASLERLNGVAGTPRTAPKSALLTGVPRRWCQNNATVMPKRRLDGVIDPEWRYNGVWTAPIPNRNAKNGVGNPLHQAAFSLRHLETRQQRMEIALLIGI